MYICICNAVTDSQIKESVSHGAKSIRDLNKEFCIADQCGKCACAAKRVIKSQINTISL
ncbi:MAG: BFD/(2Fe-2S)-binding domain-containing protein [Osedax symbiont Rs2]|nr:MAG: BFD/(2Fe-2S)-binding domain-containing protein [Osedax symbiont Rs2]